eukprot:scaffold22560_cov135-Cylindrotheca_fusiformis.AAC.41
MKNYVKHDPDTCMKLLEECEMFRKVPPSGLAEIASKMKYRVLERNELLLRQGESTDRFFLLESGDVRRTFKDRETERTHNVEYEIRARSIGAMRVIEGSPVYSTVKCVSDSCKVFEMHRDDLLTILKRDPELSIRIVEGLCEDIRRGSRKYQTPLLQQKQQEVNIPAVSIAAGIESYYRSALNSILNTRLTGVPSQLFPNMHIQVPSRISYICGFKALRASLDERVDPDVYEYPTSVRLAAAVAPGIIMTPISSLLEASNAGHLNSEPIYKRWIRGIVPRAGREVVFGIGLNQLSDYFEERVESFFPDNVIMANALGSLMAGVVSGYFSHVPHNLSTFKLMEPHRPYGELYKMFVDKSVPPAVDRMVASWPPQAKRWTRATVATLFPRGLTIRTTQIIGSFIILNGTINLLQMREWKKIERVARGIQLS